MMYTVFSSVEWTCVWHLLCEGEVLLRSLYNIEIKPNAVEWCLLCFKHWYFFSHFAGVGTEQKVAEEAGYKPLAFFHVIWNGR